MGIDRSGAVGNTGADTAEEVSSAVLLAARAGGVAVLAYADDGACAAILDADAPMVIGRASSCDLRVSSATVSRRHCRLTLRSERVLVEDLGSRNGTWIAGRRVERAEIQVGDDLVVGTVPVTLFSAPPDALGAGAARGRDERGPSEGLVVGAGLRGMMTMLERIGDSRAPVVLQGETGTGKEVFARLLHERSPRAAKRMVRINCGAVPRDLVESTFFGHERGAFTGAVQVQRGAFEDANGSTLFLDEVAELPLAAQAALLRVLEVGAFCRVGSTREQPADVRVVAATHRDLGAMVRQGTFREDLYYRMSTFTLQIPPLRERRDEIEVLARRFLSTASRANGRHVDELSAEVLARLLRHDWPGNIRELRNVIERAVVLARGRTLTLDDLPPAFGADHAGGAAPVTTPHHGDTGGRHDRLHDYEAMMITEALEACGWHTGEAARRLQMARRTLTRRMLALGIQKPLATKTSSPRT